MDKTQDLTLAFNAILHDKASVVATFIIALTILAAFTLRSSDLPNEPTKIPHVLPFLGHALTFAKDKRAFFLKSHLWNREKPFRALIGGRNHYVFSEPADVAAVHKNAKTLNIRAFVRFIYISIWGFKAADADRFWEIKPVWHQIDIDWLLDMTKNDHITIKYLDKLRGWFDELDVQLSLSPGGEMEVDALLSVVRLQGKATVQTLYGETTLERHPTIVDDLAIMVGEGFWPLMFRLPRFTARRSYQARDRLIAAYKELYENFEDRPDCSQYLRERFAYLKEQGMSGESVGSDCLRIMFASLLNSMPTGYLALMQIVMQPGLLGTVRKELTTAGYSPSETPEKLLDIVPGKTPLLRSIWFETLRLHNNSLTVREVTAPTRLNGTQTWDLKPGGVVSIPCGLMHFNEKLHPDAYAFRADRFMEKALGGAGESAARTTKPFGGGSTHCPGRVFAEKQMIGLVAAFIMRFNIKMVNEKFDIPPVSEFDDIWNRPRAILKISRREMASA